MFKQYKPVICTLAILSLYIACKLLYTVLGPYVGFPFF